MATASPTLAQVSVERRPRLGETIRAIALGETIRATAASTRFRVLAGVNRPGSMESISPSWTAVGVTQLALPELLVEIRAVAVPDSGPRVRR
jgi:hypothetical protein